MNVAERAVELDQDCSVYVSELPAVLRPGREIFDRIWDLHPEEFAEILIHGKLVKTPRWQAAYGRDYRFSGQIAQALAMPEEFDAYMRFVQGAYDPRLNGALVNWYDASLGHYIGQHRDSRKGLVEGSPIVTVSLGEDRVFRFSQKGQPNHDILASDGSVIRIPYAVNLAWKHGVPKFARYAGRRISLTFRAFE